MRFRLNTSSSPDSLEIMERNEFLGQSPSTTEMALCFGVQRHWQPVQSSQSGLFFLLADRGFQQGKRSLMELNGPNVA